MSTRIFCTFSILFIELIHPSWGDDPRSTGRSYPEHSAQQKDLFRRDNLVAWCIVPFDDQKRSPQDRAEMLSRLRITKFAYDYRGEHIPQFDAEMEAIKAKNIELIGWWFPTTLNEEAQHILDVLRRHQIRTQLWVTGGGAPTSNAVEHRERVVEEAARIRPIAEAAEKIGCRVGLYNHGGWFGEPENQIAIIEELNLSNVGIVYNLHHGHDHVARFPELLRRMLPHLLTLNLNGMVPEGDRKHQKILPIGVGSLDESLLAAIRDSGYQGPIGILNHTQENAELRLLDNLEGLEWLADKLRGKRSPPPQLRTYPVANSAQPTSAVPYSAQFVFQRVHEAKERGQAARGATVFARGTQACLSCHKLGKHGGTLGPELTTIGQRLSPVQLAESLYWPKRSVAADYHAVGLLLESGATVQGYFKGEDSDGYTLRDTATGKETVIAKSQVDEFREIGSLMPEGIVNMLSENDQRDLLRFLMDLGVHRELSAAAVDSILQEAHPTAPASFPYDRKPLNPEAWPSWQKPVNRDRIYDYYSKQGHFFRGICSTIRLFPEFPGLDGGVQGHWGNQSETTWMDGRWNDTDLGSVQCGIFRGPENVTVKRAVCFRLPSSPPINVCYDPDSMNFVACWEGDFLRFSDVRHGFLDGIRPAGEKFRLLDLPFDSSFSQAKPRYRGYYRHGEQIVFSLEVAGEEYLDSVIVEGGELTRVTKPKSQHPQREWTKGGPAQWPQLISTNGQLGNGTPYAIDTIQLPFDNPWKALLFVGDHGFLPDGSAVICTMQGDVWRVNGLDGDWQTFTWRRIASGLNQTLGLVTVGEELYLLGRDQITRLRDLNGDGESDFYECFSKAFITSAGGHDFLCGLQRDDEGRFYLASGNQGLVRISADGQSAELIAFGFRNPDGLGLLSDSALTVPSSEGEWVPASMIALIKPQQTKPQQINPLQSGLESQPHGGIPYFGYGGPQKAPEVALPLVYLPRGLDNSSGGQSWVDNDRWGVPRGTAIHLSYGAAAAFLLLRDEVRGQSQGAVVPIGGEFRSGVHRGKFHPHDGQLYVSGMQGWGCYAPDDGCLQRMRWNPMEGNPAHGNVPLPIGFHVHENGIVIDFQRELDRSAASVPSNHFAQCWNYRYSNAYGSAEYSTKHAGLRGHDVLPISSSHLVKDGKSIFLELPDLQPVNQLHLQIQAGPILDNDGRHGQSHVDLFLTVHALDVPFTSFPGYQRRQKEIWPHPMARDLATLTRSRKNPYQKSIPGARVIEVETAGNLSYVQRQLSVRAGEAIQLVFLNADTVPHNWVLVNPGTLANVGDLVNKLITDPEAAAKHYIPDTNDVLAYTDVVEPFARSTIYFRAPAKPGRYPYLCTFPGHWMVMNGELVVE